MSCPATGTMSGSRPTTSIEPTASVAPADSSAPEDVVDRFDRVRGSVFMGLFAAALYDQAMLPAVSAALQATGRIRDDPIGRALRTAASEQLQFAGLEVDSRVEAERLLQLHRGVKGVAPDGSRYSALNPESWNWVLVSTFFMHRGAFIAITGTQLSAAGNQMIWNRFREFSRDLHLRGRGAQLIEDYDELHAYYEKMARERLRRTATLECAVRALLRPKRPDRMPTVVGPLWGLVSKAVGHLLAVLGFGIMHPEVRALVPMRWTWRHNIEFAALTMLLRFGYRWLPRNLTDTPLVRNRRRYERIVERYRRIGLTSFAPPNTAKGDESLRAQRDLRLQKR